MSRLTIRPMRPEDLAAIAVQEAQAAIGPELTPETGAALQAAGVGFTGLVDGRPVAIAGVILSMGAPAIAWAVLAETARRWLTPLTRAIRRFLDGFGKAIETGVAKGFAAGARWARLLGFWPTGAPVRWGAADELAWRRSPPAAPQRGEG